MLPSFLQGNCGDEYKGYAKWLDPTSGVCSFATEDICALLVPEFPECEGTFFHWSEKTVPMQSAYTGCYCATDTCESKIGSTYDCHGHCHYNVYEIPPQLDPTPQPTPQPTLQPTSTCNIDELKDSDGNCLPKCEAGDALVDGVCRKVCTDRRRLSRNFGPEFSSDTSGDGPSLQHMRHLADEDCVDIEDANGDCPAEVMALGATGAICFTGDSLLTLQDGSNIKFNNLQVSESIRVDSSRVESSRVESSYEDE